MLKIDRGTVAHQSNSPTYCEGSESPDGNTEGPALTVEEAPMKGQNVKVDNANGTAPAELRDQHALEEIGLLV